MYANTGKILRINLDDNRISVFSPDEDLYKNYIGGSGLASRLFYDMADFNCPALDPRAMLIFMNGPMAGVKFSGTSRMSAVARSPLTDIFAESSCGGHFPPQLRYAGFDGMIITGKASKPSLIYISSGKAEIQEAGWLWGTGVIEANEKIKTKFGAQSKSLVIGPAGENLVSFACILSNAHHAFGRCGFGAVMGSKNLKAIVVEHQNFKQTYYDSEKLITLTNEISPRIKEHIFTQVLNDFGSAGNLEGHMYTGDVPIKNWSENFNEEMAEALTGSTLSERFLTRKASCAYCVVACKRIIRIDDGTFALAEGPGPEYETVAALGCLLNSSDLAAVCKAGRVCNDLGMDTISAGATIAWAMEAFEKGHLTLKETDGIALEWGDLHTVIEKVLPAIAAQKGNLGRLLADGSKKAAMKTGRNSIAYTAQSKGLEAPMHDPRGGGHGHALAYAVSPRGACHVSTAMHFMETGACNYPEIGFEFDLEALTDEKKPETMVLAASIGSIENSACFCQYADRPLSFIEMCELLNLASGYEHTPQSLIEAGLRIYHLKRLINHKYGMEKKDDALSPRMLEPAKEGDGAGIVINFDSMLNKFYKLMNFDDHKGIAGEDTLRKFKLL